MHRQRGIFRGLPNLVGRGQRVDAGVLWTDVLDRQLERLRVAVLEHVEPRR